MSWKLVHQGMMKYLHLYYLCNMSLDQGIFPKELKLANIIPLYKA